MTRDKAINILARLAGGATQPSWDDIRKAAKFAYDVLSASKEDEVHIQFNDDRTLPKQQPQGLDETPKRKLRKVCNLREELKDEPIEEKLQELREIRAEKDRLDEAAEEYAEKNKNEWEVPIESLIYGTPRTRTDNDKWEIKDAFKAGAKWMAEQGWNRELEVKEDAGGYPYIDKHIELYDYDTDKPFAKKGDKVIVQIRKK